MAYCVTSCLVYLLSYLCNISQIRKILKKQLTTKQQTLRAAGYGTETFVSC